MRFIGQIKIYSPSRGYGYIALEEYEDVLFHQKDLPWSYIEPRVGETLEFTVLDQQGKLMAGKIRRPEISVEPNLKHKIKQLYYKTKLNFRFQSKAQQRKILLLIGMISLIMVLIATYTAQHFYQNYQQNKAQQMMLEQQKYIAAQRALHGDLPEVILGEEAKRNLTGQVYGVVKPRSEDVSNSIDKLNGRLPVSMGKFKCDGRVYCSEMRSYAEAVYFHKHCRGTKLDGNGNGKPCENDMRWAKQ